MGLQVFDGGFRLIGYEADVAMDSIEEGILTLVVPVYLLTVSSVFLFVPKRSHQERPTTVLKVHEINIPASPLRSLNGGSSLVLALHHSLA